MHDTHIIYQFKWARVLLRDRSKDTFMRAVCAQRGICLGTIDFIDPWSNLSVGYRLVPGDDVTEDELELRR